MAVKTRMGCAAGCSAGHSEAPRSPQENVEGDVLQDPLKCHIRESVDDLVTGDVLQITRGRHVLHGYEEKF